MQRHDFNKNPLQPGIHSCTRDVNTCTCAAPSSRVAQQRRDAVCVLSALQDEIIPRYRRSANWAAFIEGSYDSAGLPLNDMRLLELYKRVRTAFVRPVKPADSDCKEPPQMSEQTSGQRSELNYIDVRLLQHDASFTHVTSLLVVLDRFASIFLGLSHKLDPHVSGGSKSAVPLL